MSKLQGEKVFTVMDASSAFHQIKLDEKSSELCCFTTPFGRYKFNRMPFGIKSGPEVFQAAINEILKDVPGVECYFDDLLIHGKSLSEHDERLELVLKRARQHNLKFDKGKLQLAQPSVTYIGYRISAEGITIPKSRGEAVKAMKVPTKKEELQNFLGVVNYSTRFVPHLASKTEYLRGLLKSGVKWKWDEKAEEDFNVIKNSISAAPTLAHFRPNGKTTIAADASLYGIGAALLQDGRPVAYVSAALNDTQRAYAQIEKELLAVVYALQKFHYYIYGTDIIVETDHKPLVGLINKPIDKLSSRIQRMVLKLQKYDPKLEYVPGKLNILADALSRNPTEEAIDTNYLEAEEKAVHQLLCVSPNKLDQLIRATEQDRFLSKLKQYIVQGWPNRYQSVENEMKPYWPYKNELYISEGLIMLNSRIVVPTDQRDEIIRKLHQSHMGMSLCKNRTKDTVFWPGITKDIEQYIHNCQGCNRFPRANTKEPLLNHPVVGRPWAKLGIDLMEWNGKKFITIIDYHSKYPEVMQTERTTAASIINLLKSIFARHGIPSEIVTDNGPPFDSNDLKDFVNNWDIIHTTSSPYYAKSNGMVERTIQTCKNRIKKSLMGGTNIYEMLLDFRTTPHNGLRSPAELLMGRQLRTFLPVTEETLKPLYPTEDTVKTLVNNQKTQKEYADRGAKVLSELVPGELVMYQHQAKDWRKGVVTQKDATPRSYQIKGPGNNVVRRNRTHIKSIVERKTGYGQRTDGHKEIDMGKEEGELVTGIKYLPKDIEPKSCSRAPNETKSTTVDEDSDEVVTMRPVREKRMPAKYADYQLEYKGAIQKTGV